MFRPEVRKSGFQRAMALFELIFHASVRHVRKAHGNAVIGLLTSIVQSMIGIGIMFMLSQLIGNTNAPVRGDRMLYIMSGIFIFLTVSYKHLDVYKRQPAAMAVFHLQPVQPVHAKARPLVAGARGPE